MRGLQGTGTMVRWNKTTYQTIKTTPQQCQGGN